MTLTITSINVNGVRAATKKRNEHNLGLNAWLAETTAEVVLLQEVRATQEQAEQALRPALEDGWHLQCAPASARGRSGVAILSRRPLEDVTVGFGSFCDAGRWLEGTYPTATGGVRVASLYLPSGAQGTAKQDEKFRFLDEFEELLALRGTEHPRMVIGGDWNICHRREDLKNWKGNLKVSGFLPDERLFLDSVFGTFPDDHTQVEQEHGTYLGALDYAGGPVRCAITPDEQTWFDVARHLQPEGPGPYTWWTYRGQAFNNDAGWRIDYQAATAAMLEAATQSWVDKAAAVELRWSDHAPLNVTYDV